MDTLQVRVERKREEAEGICSFTLCSVGGHPLPSFAAGSHIDVLTPSGTTGQYSLCGICGSTGGYLIAVLREHGGRGGSASMHDQVHEGDLLTISIPKNHFALSSDAGRSLLLAGGIGITPILCMAERLAHIGSPFEMHYSARSAAHAAFREYLSTSAFADRVFFHYSADGPRERVDLAKLLSHPDDRTHLYVCGPRGYMEAVLACARSSGWCESRIHYEFFAGADFAGAAAGSFEVQISSTGMVVHVPADKSIVHALQEAGVEVPTSCEQGVCGTCLTRVLEGNPDHRDMYLTMAEQEANDQMLPCCSRSHSPRLVLDI